MDTGSGIMQLLLSSIGVGGAGIACLARVRLVQKVPVGREQEAFCYFEHYSAVVPQSLNEGRSSWAAVD